MSTTSPLQSLQEIMEIRDNSWLNQLAPETDEHLLQSRKHEGLDPKQDSNQTKRPVYNGHYVRVAPQGLKNPQLVIYSPDVAEHLLGLSKDLLTSPSEDFVRWLAGHPYSTETSSVESWATPYALSIMGSRYTSNCPYGTGNGYGDGRAISIAEFNGQELQLKGGGTTPFHRGADGRAVLRSSIREFLASEAMHHLGVSTTRALSLVKGDDFVSRPWYSEGAKLDIPDMDDPRLQDYSMEQRKEIIQQLRTRKADPNVMRREQTAITCRVAPSFTRIGHIDLFSRRLTRKKGGTYDTSTLEWKEYEQMVWHACYREYREEAYNPFYPAQDLASASRKLLQHAAVNIATMVAGWIRVGFSQGNFNGDNCLIAGRTMDYGPFSFVDEYHPLFAKWTGSGNHFGFANQPSAGLANYGVLVSSLIPAIVSSNPGLKEEDVEEEFMSEAEQIFQQKVDEVARLKLGFTEDQDVADDLWEELQKLMLDSRTDWAIFFRRLTYILKDGSALAEEGGSSMLEALENTSAIDRSGSFYDDLDSATRDRWTSWLEKWRDALKTSGSIDSAYSRMVLANPKYILREWMLVDAYTDAANGNNSEVQNLFDLIQNPYDEGTEEQEAKYFQRASEDALTTAGVAFFS